MLSSLETTGDPNLKEQQSHPSESRSGSVAENKPVPAGEGNRFSARSILVIHLPTSLCAGINHCSSADRFMPGENSSPASRHLENRSDRRKRKKRCPSGSVEKCYGQKGARLRTGTGEGRQCPPVASSSAGCWGVKGPGSGQAATGAPIQQGGWDFHQMCLARDDPWIKDLSENQRRARKKAGEHTLCGIKLPRHGSVPPALTSPCAKQGARPGQRTQMNSTGKKRLCKIPRSLTSFTSRLLFISLGAARGQRGVSLARAGRAGVLSHGAGGSGWSLDLAPTVLKKKV